MARHRQSPGAGLAMQWVLQLRVCSTALQLQRHLQWRGGYTSVVAILALICKHGGYTFIRIALKCTEICIINYTLALAMVLIH